MVRDMHWWNDFLNWLGSDAGWRVLTTAVFPFIAIVIAGIIAALIGRGAARRLLAHHDRELQAAAISAMVEAGRTATMWSSLSTGAQTHSDSQFNAADIRVRLLPLSGASAAADWATHEIRAMRRDSAGFSFQADQTFADYRDRLLEWQRRPGRARKLFALDLERFRFEDSSADNELVDQQRRWAATQAAAEQAAVAVDAPAEPAATPTPIVASAPVSEPVLEPVAEPIATPEATTEPAPATQAYAMPVAASDHVNESATENTTENTTDSETAGHPSSDEASSDATEPEPDSVEPEFVEPVLEEHSNATSDSHEDSGDDNGDDNGDHSNESGEQAWNGQQTQAMPLIEPEQSYASSHNSDENRAL
jgi:hypothetical protein